MTSLRELESLMYARVEQRLRHVTGRNKLPAPAMHYHYMTSSGQLVERPGSPMISGPVGAVHGVGMSAPGLVHAAPLAHSVASVLGNRSQSAPSWSAQAQYLTPPGHPAQTVTGPVRTPVSGVVRTPVNYSPPHLIPVTPERPVRPKAPSPNSIHKDLLLPPDATDAEVEQNLRATETANSALLRTLSADDTRDYVTSPPSIIQSHQQYHVGTPFAHGMMTSPARDRSPAHAS